MYQGGYPGKIRRVCPTDPAANKDELPPIMLKDFIGVTVFEVWDFSGKLPTDRDPSRPDYKLRFSFGHLSSTTIQTKSRMAVGAKTPSSDITECDLPSAHFPPDKKTKQLELEYAAGP